MDLSSIIRANNVTRERLRELVGRMSDIDLTRDLGDGWTIAAVLAHCAFYDLRIVALFERWQQTGEVAALPVEANILNAALLPLALALPPRAAANLAVEAAEAADGKVAELELEMDLMDKLEEAKGLAVSLLRSEHRKEHIRQIEAALVSLSSAPKKPSVRVKAGEKPDKKLRG
ncbi:MAG: DinB family protein [Anaerolineales bacterium]|nr:DinB family protein [Anaerolineales bacterium]